MDSPIRVAIIIGSTREGRFGPTVARWIADHAAQRDDMDVDVIDLAEMDLPAAYPQRFSPAVRAYLARLDRADAFIVVTPEYNHSFPAALKQAIDLGGREWQAKPVAFVSYGGMSGGLRAVEHLRQVFAELHAVTIRDTVSFHNYGRQFDPSGQPLDAAGTGAAAKTMLDQLAWWATALRTARATRPYAA
ncbi:MAG: NAD(P)H-dependent oxidoreductase [Actinomycetota bacterium]|jgi:NAD(P)H-dependent FMN reductase